MTTQEFKYDSNKKRITFFKNGKPTGGIIGELAKIKFKKLTNGRKFK